MLPVQLCARGTQGRRALAAALAARGPLLGHAAVRMAAEAEETLAVLVAAPLAASWAAVAAGRHGVHVMEGPRGDLLLLVHLAPLPPPMARVNPEKHKGDEDEYALPRGAMSARATLAVHIAQDRQQERMANVTVLSSLALPPLPGRYARWAADDFLAGAVDAVRAAVAEAVKDAPMPDVTKLASWDDLASCPGSDGEESGSDEEAAPRRRTKGKAKAKGKRRGSASPAPEPPPQLPPQLPPFPTEKVTAQLAAQLPDLLMPALTRLVLDGRDGEPALADQVAERLGTRDPEQAFDALVRGVGEGELPARDWLWMARDGSRRIVSMTLSATEASVTTQVGFLCVGRDVTEQRQGQDMLVQALEKERTAVERLRALDEAKNEFVSTVSHELRTPVTSIVGYTEMLQDGTVVEPLEDQLPLFATIARNGQRLIVLCNDLLTLAGLDSESITWEAEEVDLGDALASAAAAVAPMLHERDLTVLWETAEEPVRVVGDPTQLERVVMNLVTNAVKFTEDGGVVRARVEVQGDEAVLSVTDTGIGIPAEEQSNLFQKFFRSSTAQKEAIQGTGLGLSIVAAIVSAHGGTIRVRSEHLEGSTFTVRLPVKY